MSDDAATPPTRQLRQPSITLSEPAKRRLVELRSDGYELGSVHAFLIREGLMRPEDGRRGYQALRRYAISIEGGALRKGTLRIRKSGEPFRLTPEMLCIVDDQLGRVPDWAIKDALIEQNLLPSWQDEAAYDAIRARRLRGEQTGRPLTIPYVRANERIGTAAKAIVFVDPDAVDRGSKAHRALQNRVADVASNYGLEVKSPLPGAPVQFDIGWHTSEAFFVVEIKSTTSENEAHQIRLGLGQALDYQHRLGAALGTVEAALVVERRPEEAERWEALCDAHGVWLGWPEVLGVLIARAGVGSAGA